jgi:DNA-binding Lrp family transcriptional regulator
MDQSKLRKLLFFLSKNARTSTKELAQLLSISQQTASYTIQKLVKEKQIIEFHLVADPAKFGLVNILVLLDYRSFEYQNIIAIKKTLKQNPNVVRIEEVSQGADLLIEYSVPNLSYFNKQHKEFLYQYKDDIKVKEVHVIIVKHHYTKNYLHKKLPENREIIISGDRDVMLLNDKQETVLKELLQDTINPITSIAKKTKLDPKTVTNIKKWLEKKRIIREYSIILNYDTLEIIREQLFLTLAYEGEHEEKRLLEFCNQHKNITAVTKIIGEYDLLITTERIDKDKPVINEIRRVFHVRDYRILDTQNILKYQFLPENLFEERKETTKQIKRAAENTPHEAPTSNS